MANDIRFNKTGDILNHYLASMQGMTSEIDSNIGENMSLNEHIGVSHELQTITLESADLITFETTLDVPLLSVIVEARCFVVDDMYIPLDEITIYHTGKNLIDVADCESAVSYRNKIASWLTPINKGDYTLSFNYDGANANFEMVVYYANSDTTETLTIETGLNTLSFIANDNITAIEFYTDEIGTFTNLQIEVGDTATAFEEYHDDNIIIDLGGDVYGCSINTAENVIIVNWGHAYLSDLTWLRHTQSTETHNVFYSTSLTDKALGMLNISSPNYITTGSGINAMPDNSIRGNSTTKTIFVCENDYDNVTDFVNNLGTKECIYVLDEPIIIPITPEVIKQFKGVNNMYVEHGTTSVTYRRYKPD